jgi:hypothetical protein
MAAVGTISAFKAPELATPPSPKKNPGPERLLETPQIDLENAHKSNTATSLLIRIHSIAQLPQEGSSPQLNAPPQKNLAVGAVDLTCHEEPISNTHPLSRAFLKRVTVTIISPSKEPPEHELKPLRDTIQEIKDTLPKILRDYFQINDHYQSISCSRLSIYNAKIEANDTYNPRLPIDFANNSNLPTVFKTMSYFDRKALLTESEVDALSSAVHCLLDRLKTLKVGLKNVDNDPICSRSRELHKFVRTTWMGCISVQNNIKRLAEDLLPNVPTFTTGSLPLIGRLQEIPSEANSSLPVGTKRYRF